MPEVEVSHVLFVCTGNLCRSPLAERLARHAVADHDGLRFTSAGTHAVNGAELHPQTRRTLLERGADADGFASRFLTPSLLANADLVVTMTRAQRDAATRLHPAGWRRTFVITELDEVLAASADPFDGRTPGDRTRSALDVPDPIGRSGAEFDRVAEQVAPLVGRLARWLLDQPRGAG
ncbi:MAG: hypothetical protein ABWX74_06920 [Aeromicrobium sp.]